MLSRGRTTGADPDHLLRFSWTGISRSRWRGACPNILAKRTSEDTPELARTAHNRLEAPFIRRVICVTVRPIAARHKSAHVNGADVATTGSRTMNNQTSMGSIQLTDKELAGVSGGDAPKPVEMEAVTIIVYTKGSTIHGKPKK